MIYVVKVLCSAVQHFSFHFPLTLWIRPTSVDTIMLICTMEFLPLMCFDDCPIIPKFGTRHHETNSNKTSFSDS